MAWELSHSADALCNARRNIRALPTETIIEALAEINASTQSESGSHYELDADKFNAEVARLTAENKRLHLHEVIADEVWTWAIETGRTTDDGGFNLLVCPYGCHEVSLSDKGNPDVE
jgi:hypothetical protein